jgi:predicted esterase
MRRWITAGLALLTLVAGLTGVAIRGNTFSMEERQITLPGASGTLAGVLTLPEHRTGRVPVVVFVHGDGPVDATNDGLYRPQFEALARAGVATVSWSKPGVGGSDADWLQQSQADRAAEVATAVRALRERPELDPDRIGLWGASQGGWVVPAAAAADPRIAFTILVSPAINWMRQGEFHLRATLANEHADDADRAAALAERNRTNAVLTNGGTYADYLATKPTGEPMTRERWEFVRKNFRTDATESLAALGRVGTPTLLLLADHDRNVDAHETERVYRSTLDADQLSVRWFTGANHSMARSDVEDSEIRAVLTAVFAPRRLMVDGYLDALAEFASAAR